MTGEFQAYIRGFEIDVEKTLREIYPDKSKYCNEDLEKYIKSLGLNQIFDVIKEDKYDVTRGFGYKPNLNGLIIISQDEDDYECKVGAFLSTGIFDHQYFNDSWDKEYIRKIHNFFSPNYMDKTNDVNEMLEYWSQYFVFIEPIEYKIYAIQSERNTIYI